MTQGGFIDLVDCTLRDGSYQVDFAFTANQTQLMTTALERAGVGWIEGGHGLGLGAAASGKVASAESDIGYMSALRAGASRAKVGVFAMPAFAALNDVAVAADQGMDFIRIGVDAARFRQAEPLIREAVSRKLHTTAFLMKSYTLPLAELEDEADIFEDWGANAVAIVDSAGGMVPDQVSDYIGAIHDRTRLGIAFHGHDNLRLACGNALTAVASGATMLDASLRGMGRSSGNAQLEALAIALIKTGYRIAPDPLALCEVAEILTAWPRSHSGVPSADLVQAMAMVHSGMQARIDRAATVYDVEPELLTLAVGEASRGLDLSEEAVDEIARRFSGANDTQLKAAS
jgi:4-hydroxy 2-oxovalerate aldolase